MTYAVGVDIGGTKIATVLIDKEQNILHRVELESVADDREKMFERVTKSIDLVLHKSKIAIDEIKGMGVGVPGKVDKDNGVAVYQNNLAWGNFPLADRLRERYPIENIRIDNDVYVATLAEWNAAEMQEEDTFVYITVSTGISCATIHRGNFIRGAGFAGELGLFPVKAKTIPSGCNRLEQVASGPAIEHVARERLNEQMLSTKDVFQKYETGCTEATEIIQQIAVSIAHGVYSIICLLDPHQIVFGGGVMNNNPFLIELIKNNLKQWVTPEQHKALQRMYISHYRENTGVVGAGLLGFS